MAKDNHITFKPEEAHPAPDLRDRITDKTGRTLNLLSDCNDALLRIAKEPELLNSICDLIVKTGGYPFAWVGYARMDEVPKITSST